MQNNVLSVRLQPFDPSYDFQPFAELLRSAIEEALEESGKNSFRKGTILIPAFPVWVILAIPLRRDLNTHAVIEW